MKRNFSKLPELKVIKHKAEENPSKKKSYKLKPRRRTNPEKSEKAKTFKNSKSLEGSTFNLPKRQKSPSHKRDYLSFKTRTLTTVNK